MTCWRHPFCHAPHQPSSMLYLFWPTLHHQQAGMMEQLLTLLLFQVGSCALLLTNIKVLAFVAICVMTFFQNVFVIYKFRTAHNVNINLWAIYVTCVIKYWNWKHNTCNKNIGSVCRHAIRDFSNRLKLRTEKCKMPSYRLSSTSTKFQQNDLWNLKIYVLPHSPLELEIWLCIQMNFKST